MLSSLGIQLRAFPALPSQEAGALRDAVVNEYSE